MLPSTTSLYTQRLLMWYFARARVLLLRQQKRGLGRKAAACFLAQAPLRRPRAGCRSPPPPVLPTRLRPREHIARPERLLSVVVASDAAVAREFAFDSLGTSLSEVQSINTANSSDESGRPVPTSGDDDYATTTALIADKPATPVTPVTPVTPAACGDAVAMPRPPPPPVQQWAHSTDSDEFDAAAEQQRRRIMKQMAHAYRSHEQAKRAKRAKRALHDRRQTQPQHSPPPPPPPPSPLLHNRMHMHMDSDDIRNWRAGLQAACRDLRFLQ